MQRKFHFYLVVNFQASGSDFRLRCRPLPSPPRQSFRLVFAGFSLDSTYEDHLLPGRIVGVSVSRYLRRLRPQSGEDGSQKRFAFGSLSDPHVFGPYSLSHLGSLLPLLVCFQPTCVLCDLSVQFGEAGGMSPVFRTCGPFSFFKPPWLFSDATLSNDCRPPCVFLFSPPPRPFTLWRTDPLSLVLVFLFSWFSPLLVVNERFGMQSSNRPPVTMINRDLVRLPERSTRLLFHFVFFLFAVLTRPLKECSFLVTRIS